MNLAEELQRLSEETSKRTNAIKEKEKKALAKKQASEEKRSTKRILRELPKKLTEHANSSDVRKYCVADVDQVSAKGPLNPSNLEGKDKMVFEGCEKMGLDTRLEFYYFDNGDRVSKYVGIWVHW